MALFSATKTSNVSLICFFLFMSLVTFQHVSCFRYEVGGEMGWIEPDGSEVETYNEWAEQHRFHIGDTINFKYRNDSVFLVEEDDYEICETSSPIIKFEDGNTVFEFDHSGFFYFISGKPGHCQAGQKMIIRVMAHPAPAHHPPASAPAPSAEGPGGSRDGGDGVIPDPVPDQTPTNSANVLSVTSCILTPFMGSVVVLYLFMD